MKHLFLTLCALLSISYAFAGKHEIWIYYDDEIASIVDQNNKEYSFYLDVPGGEPIFLGYYHGDVEDGTTLTFTFVEGSKKSVICTDEDDNDVAKGYVITIDASMPAVLYFAAADPTANVQVNIPGVDICDPNNSLGIKLEIDGMKQSLSDYCTDGGSLLITELNEGVTFCLKSDVPVDWDSNEDTEPTKEYCDEITEEIIDGPGEIVIGNEAWDASNPNWNIWEKAGKRNITYSNRTILANMWNTICFPFDINSEQMRHNFGIVVEFIGATFSESTGLEIECAPVTSMKANTPYLVMPSQTKSTFNFMGVEVKVNEASGKFEPEIVGTADDPVNFVGVLKPVTLYADDHSVLFVTAGNKVTYPNVTADIKEFRGYFRVTPSNPASGRRARACIVIRDRKEEPTALNDNVMQNNNTKKYMQDGRLVIEINGVRYNAQGQAID